MTKEDRYAAAMAASKPLAELASISDAHLNKIVASLSSLTREEQRLAATAGGAATRARTAVGRGHRQSAARKPGQAALEAQTILSKRKQQQTFPVQQTTKKKHVRRVMKPVCHDLCSIV